MQTNLSTYNLGYTTSSFGFTVSGEPLEKRNVRYANPKNRRWVCAVIPSRKTAHYNQNITVA